MVFDKHLLLNDADLAEPLTSFSVADFATAVPSAAASTLVGPKPRPFKLFRRFDCTMFQERGGIPSLVTGCLDCCNMQRMTGCDWAQSSSLSLSLEEVRT